MTKTIKNKIVYEEVFGNLKGKAIAVVFPSSDEELENLVRISNNDIIPRGYGTSFTGACLPRNSVIVDFSKSNKIIGINAERKTAYVEAGVTLKELNDALEPYNLEFPIVPLFPGIETIGGAIAKNASGARELKYGRMIKWIDGIEVIDGNGFSKIGKSDLSDFAGMEGTTGLILRAKLRLTTRKERSLSILKSENLKNIISANAKLRLNHDICSIDLLNPTVSFLLGFERKYHLFVEYENSEGLFKKDEYEKFFHLKNQIYKKIAGEGFNMIEDIKLFSDNIMDFMIYLEGERIPYFAHLSSGLVFPCLNLEDKEKHSKMLEVARKMRGDISYNFGFGLLKKEFLDVNARELLKRVKKRRDPKGIFNRNKMLDADFLGLEEEKPEEIEQKIEKEETKQKEQKKSEENKENQEENPEEKEKIKKIAFGLFAGGE